MFQPFTQIRRCFKIMSFRVGGIEKHEKHFSVVRENMKIFISPLSDISNISFMPHHVVVVAR